MKSISDKKAAMEMSVGTIVTIVLLMGVLVLGIFLVQRIFRAGTGAVDSIDAEIQNQISKLFAEEGREVAVFPTSRRITLSQGDSNKGFAFSVKNIGDTASIEFRTEATDTSNCRGLSDSEATDWVLGGSGGVPNLGPGATIDTRLVTFIIPNNAPLCTLEYTLFIDKDDENIASPNIFVEVT